MYPIIIHVRVYDRFLFNRQIDPFLWKDAVVLWFYSGERAHMDTRNRKRDEKVTKPV